MGGRRQLGRARSPRRSTRCKSAGGNVIISFGGESGGELAQTCTSVSSADRRLRQRGEHLRREPAGLRHRGRHAGRHGLQQPPRTRPWPPSRRRTRRSRSTTPSRWPRAGCPPRQLERAAERADLGREGQRREHHDHGLRQRPERAGRRRVRRAGDRLASWPACTGSPPARRTPGWGLTPIAGQNDDNEYFSQANASTLESFAASNGVQELSFWEVDGYDKPVGYAYSKIFNQITSGSTGGGGGGGTSATGPVTGYGGLCLDVRGASIGRLHRGAGLHLQRHRCPAVDGRQR